MARFYIATKIQRALEHNIVRDILVQEGHTLTYDWTTHGSVKGVSIERLTDISDKMINAILTADFVVVLLPGGRGTHVELGAALAAEKPIFIHSEDKEVFLLSDKTTAFYHHSPLVTQLVCPFEELEKYLIDLSFTLNNV